ncbi:MAG: prolipoprotein diacylglyceryl transferase [Phycisphaerales bacterium]|nr:MAG: prolipoprotein diacylglyceryl transferase [Phycisphaerales bacterium]
MWPWFGSIPAFGALYSIGILSHFVAGYMLAKRLGLRRRLWIGVGICYLVGMTLGAKVLYDIASGGFDVRALLSPAHYLQGGLWGGLFAYMALAVPFALVLSRDKRGALDLVALTIPVPWIFAKLGCLLNGCCYGRPCSAPWAITFGQAARGAPAGVPVHPTQVYEILVAVGVIVLFVALRGERWRGTRLLWFLVIYGFGRASTEFWRGDLEKNIHIGPVSVSQLICLAAAGASLVLLLFLRRGMCKAQSRKSLNDPSATA